MSVTPSIWLAENERNTRNRKLYSDIIAEVHGSTNIGIGHHLMFQLADGSSEEYPSIDTLIFSHDVARKIWGTDWDYVLGVLAVTPVPERDLLLSGFYYDEKRSPSRARD